MGQGFTSKHRNKMVDVMQLLLTAILGPWAAWFWSLDRPISLLGSFKFCIHVLMQIMSLADARLVNLLALTAALFVIYTMNRFLRVTYFVITASARIIRYIFILLTVTVRGIRAAWRHHVSA